MKRIYRWRSQEAIERFKSGFTKQSKYWTEHLGYDDFEVLGKDINGNILKVRVGDIIVEANRGPLEMYWCLFLRSRAEEYFIDLTGGEPEVPQSSEPEDCFVITTSHKACERAIVHGPFTRAVADDFAIKQLRNAVEGVRCLVTKLVGEAKAIYKVE